MNELRRYPWGLLVAVVLLVSYLGVGRGAAQEEGKTAMLGTLKAERILFLGNSITLHGRHEPYGWLHDCGMAASVPEKDYVHILAAGLQARTGKPLWLSRTASAEGTQPANIVNLADLFERNYSQYTKASLQAQLDFKPDLVVLQCGENVPRDTLEAAAFKTGLQALLADLQAAGNPQLFITSQILGDGGTLDEIKRELCAQDPTHRTYVDLSAFHRDPSNLASSEPYYKGIIVGHPGDKGMGVIAAALLAAMVARGAQPAP